MDQNANFRRIKPDAVFGADAIFGGDAVFASDILSGFEQAAQARKAEHCENCCLGIPYPPVAVSYPCDKNGKQLLKLYAGNVSELTCVLKYLYFNFVFRAGCREVSDLMLCVSKCEMEHLQMLGELCALLGVDPRYRAIAPNNAPRYWNAEPAVVGYTKSLGMALLGSIEGEKRAIDCYQKAMMKIDDEKINLLLRRIIMDEEHHIELFEDAFRRFCR